MKGVNENDYSVKMQDYAAVNSKLNNSDLGNPDLVRWSKLTRPTLPANLASIIGNSKSPIINQQQQQTQANIMNPSSNSLNANISSSLVHKKFNNLSQVILVLILITNEYPS
jgi:hypothetical protein